MVSKVEIKEAIFKVLEDNGLVVTDVLVGDGYFIFDMGKDSVVHFSIEGCKGWRFGIWINEIPSEDDGKESASGKKMKVGNLVEIFGQHKDFIDKFKPSYSPISHYMYGVNELDMTDKEHSYGLWNLMWEFIDEVKFMKASPIFAKIHFNLDEYGLESKWGNNKVIPHFISTEFYYRVKQPIRKFFEFKVNKALGTIIAGWIGFWNKKYLIAKCVDNNIAGCVAYPHYLIQIRYKTDDNEIMHKLYDRYFGNHSNIGFGKEIRVEHFDSIDAKRSFYYPSDDE